jgi:hypothetical protein
MVVNPEIDRLLNNQIRFRLRVTEKVRSLKLFFTSPTPIGCPWSLAFGDRGYHEPHARSASAWTASPLQIISLLRRTMISEVFLQIIVRHLLFAPLFSRKRLGEAETARNSLSWNILQGTSLFSRFYSATLPVSSRKQVICIQNRGGGG